MLFLILQIQKNYLEWVNMKLYDFGLEYLKTHLPECQLEGEDIGIVTATDSNTFIGVKTLFYSIRDKINFVCYDLGMSSEELDWCKENGLQTIKFDITIPLIDKWQMFLKPFVIQQSPYDYTIWIDSDCIVTKDLSLSSVIQNRQTFFTRHWINPKHVKKNNNKLYELYPVEGDSDSLNAGVIGFNKSQDLDILEQWIHLINIGLYDDTGTIRSYLAMHDEGALTWALRKTNKGNKIINDSRYNLYSEFIGNSYTVNDIKDFYDSPIQQLSDYIVPSRFFKRVLDSNAFVCHFSTCMVNSNKYWLRWT